MPAAICFNVPSEARWQLEQLRRGARDGRLIHRATVVLMTADGRSVAEITGATGLKRGAVSKWRKRYLDEGLHGLYDRPHPGAEPKANAQYLQLLRKTIKRSPRKLGYAFNMWTAARLAEYMGIKTGVYITPYWLTELLKHRLDYSYQRPKHTLKGKRDEKAHRRAKKRLEELKKGLSRTGRPMSSGTKTRPNSISTPTSPPYGPRGGSSRGWKVRVRTRSGWSTAPLASRRGRSFMTSAGPRAVWASMTW
jgi:transposase